jgi:malate dehydrogenase
MIDAIVNNRHRIMSCCVYLTGEYGHHDVCLGVPVKIGRTGMEEILLIDLSKEEKAAFDKSAEDVKSMLKGMKDRKAAAK